MNLPVQQLARMVDLSTVRPDTTEAEVRAMAEMARGYRCICASTLPGHTPLLVDLLADEPEIGVSGNVSFPSAGATRSMKIAEARELLQVGCDELDVVINIGLLRSGQYGRALDDIKGVVETAGQVPVKAILECHYLSDDEIRRACELCIQAGAAFVKTGTGWAPTGAGCSHLGDVASRVYYVQNSSASQFEGDDATRMWEQSVCVSSRFGVECFTVGHRIKKHRQVRSGKVSNQFDVNEIRAQFPALAQVGPKKSPTVFLDNPGGTQVHRSVVEAMTDYLLHYNANHGGAFATSQRSDAILDEAHAAMADMLNATSPDEIVFGPNMTTLTLGVSRALAREIGPGDEIVVTRMDHDANISPWLLVAEDRGAVVRWADFDVEDYTLDMAALRELINEKTRIVAVGCASNATGTVHDVKQIVDWAHEAGALAFVDAVQYAPHGPIDVQALDCDLLAVSAYKFYGAHMGVLYGNYDLLDRLQAYKVRPAPKDPPGKYETGTQNHEGIAGTLAAVNYLAQIGEIYGKDYVDRFPGFSGRRLHLKTGMTVLREYDHVLSTAILDELETLPGVQIHGITDRNRLEERVPTVSFTWGDRHPRDIAAALGEQDIFVWDGNYYALAVTERLGLEGKGGMVRIGAVHYNTAEEIQRLGDALRAMA